MSGAQAPIVYGTAWGLPIKPQGWDRGILSSMANCFDVCRIGLACAAACVRDPGLGGRVQAWAHIRKCASLETAIDTAS